MGDEMAEMMSQEITRVMEQQRHLEKEYARLVTLRSDLKGLSNKHQLQEIRGEILVRLKLEVWLMCVSIDCGKAAEGVNKDAVQTVARQPRCGRQPEEDQD